MINTNQFSSINGAGRMAVKTDLDIVGIVLSTLCVLQCAFLPMLIALMPSLAAAFIVDESVEWIVLTAALATALTAFIRGFHRYHRRWSVFGYFALGVVFIAGAKLLHIGWEPMLVSTGALTVAYAHLHNRRLCKTCPVCNIENGDRS